MPFLRHTVDTVFLMLGPRCNFSCRYCLQRPLIPKRNRPDSALPDPAVTGFLKTLAARQETPLRVHFYGGEPFLYMDAVRAVTEALRGEPGITFSALTNGSLMDEETAEWCNSRGVRVAVSWDGPNTAAVRGRDVFAGPERAALLRLKNLGISAVISAYAYPLEIVEAYAALDREYHALHGYNAGLNFDEIMDAGLADRSLFDIDLARVSRDMAAIAGECEKALRGEDHDPWAANIGQGYLGRLRQSLRGAHTLERGTCACGNGVTVLNLDLAGNLYRCHNTDRPVGSIRDSFAAYLNRLMLLDPTRENSRACKHCPVAALCNCGCPLIGPKERAETYCPLKKAMFGPIVDMVLRLGSARPHERETGGNGGAHG